MSVKYSFYVIGAVGALLLARSLHLYKKFTHLSGIPGEFITKSIPFQGRVRAVDRDHRLHVDHLPIFTFSWMPTSDGLLPVRLAGVQVTPVGSKWLADHVLDKVVRVTPLQVTADVLDSVVFLEKGFLRRSVCVNQSLVEQGLCKVSYPSPLPASDLYINLLDTLIRCETRADRKGRGLWGGASQTQLPPQEHKRWGLKNAWNWLYGKFVKRKT